MVYAHMRVTSSIWFVKPLYGLEGSRKHRFMVAYAEICRRVD